MTADRPDRLTYAEATPEQVAAAREQARQRLADARARHTPGYWERLRARLGLPARTA